MKTINYQVSSDTAEILSTIKELSDLTSKVLNIYEDMKDRVLFHNDAKDMDIAITEVHSNYEEVLYKLMKENISDHMVRTQKGETKNI